MATLLLIEDSETQRAEIRAAVDDSLLFERVLDAGDGLQGLRMLLSEPVDVVLCDLELPGLDGEKLLRMRKGNGNADVPFVFLSAVTDGDRRARLLRAGAADSITKPFHRADLLARLELHVKLRRLQQELIDKNRQLQQLSTTDALTGLRNRRFLTEMLAIEFMRARRYGHELAVVLADLDHFKKVNDGHGHAAGDLVLRGIGDTVRARLRRTDYGGRYGGEEFLVVLAHTAPEGARAFAECWREDVEAREFVLGDDTALSATLSLGVAVCEPGIETAGDLVAAADRALYRAKDEGRNQVFVLDEDRL